MLQERIVITGIGLTSPLGNDLDSFRANLLAGKSGVTTFPVRNMGDLPAGYATLKRPSTKKEKKLESVLVQGESEFIVLMRL